MCSLKESICSLEELICTVHHFRQFDKVQTRSPTFPRWHLRSTVPEVCKYSIAGNPMLHFQASKPQHSESAGPVALGFADSTTHLECALARSCAESSPALPLTLSRSRRLPATVVGVTGRQSD
ncbi:hypothetical protein M758_10G073200 [Ceratodon purpureus]|nr:hypothetical protein M758_10G073200 [Ceratodon purpureus]